MKRIGIRSLVISSMALLLLLVGLISWSLARLNSDMHAEATMIRLAMTSVRAAQSLKIHVLNHAREQSLYDLTGEWRYHVQGARERTAILRGLKDADALETTTREQGLLRDAETKVHAYLRGRRVTMGGTADEIAQARTRLETALTSLETLVRDSQARADRAIERTSAMDKLSGRVSLLSFLATLAILCLLTFGAFHYVYRPLLKAYAAIREYADGSKNARVPETGPAELREIAVRFNHLADQINEFDRNRLRFLVGTAHDLRNPVAAMKLAVSLYRRRSQELTPEERDRNLSMIERQTRRLENLTSSFMEVMRIEAGDVSLNIKRTDLRQLVDEVIQLWAASTENHNLVPRLPAEPLFADCDAVRIEQVISNLLSNAIKYSPEGGTIIVTLSQAGASARITVEDEGLGISREDLDRIFEPFQRSIPTQDMVPGTGIGLWIGKRLVEAHHGQIRVTSTLGRGSAFTVEFPLAAPQAQAA